MILRFQRLINSIKVTWMSFSKQISYLFNFFLFCRIGTKFIAMVLLHLKYFPFCLIKPSTWRKVTNEQTLNWYFTQTKLYFMWHKIVGMSCLILRRLLRCAAKVFMCAAKLSFLFVLISGIQCMILHYFNTVLLFLGVLKRYYNGIQHLGF